jgi:2-oxoglutarate ferredoxin oxidoreductase subunit beta
VAVQREHLTDLIEQGIRHKGFSFIEIITSCSSFNTKHISITKVLQRMKPLPSTPPEHFEALRLAADPRDIYLGVFRNVDRPTLGEFAEKAQHTSQKSGPVTPEKLLQEFS